MSEEHSIMQTELGSIHAFNMELEPVSWEKVREEIAPQGVNIETNELVDQKFVILRMKRFLSRFEGQEYAYFVVGYTSKDQELFNTVIGGGQPMEVLDTLKDQGIDQPIEFILRWYDGGRYGGYYTLE